MSASIYTNPAAKDWQYQGQPDFTLIQTFHQKLPNYKHTPLVPLHDIAKELGVRGVYVKDESNRLDLPAYKILGASWGVYRTIAKRANLPEDASLEDVATAAQKMQAHLFAATEGNHGRAVARMAKLLGIKANIYVAGFTDQPVKDNIATEGAKVITVKGIYDDAVEAASKDCKTEPCGLQIQDVAIDGTSEVCEWIIEGYSTLVNEVEQQLADLGLKATVISAPIGAGSLGHAVVAFCKSSGRGIRVLTTEPEAAACLNHNLNLGRHETIKTTKTIMDGMNCGTVSEMSWLTLRHGVDVSVTITDKQCHECVTYLQDHGVNAGPCGAAQLAGLRMVAQNIPSALGLDENSVVVLLSTEGKRFYVVPE